MSSIFRRVFFVALFADPIKVQRSENRTKKYIRARDGSEQIRPCSGDEVMPNLKLSSDIIHTVESLGCDAPGIYIFQFNPSPFEPL